jgi:malate dehydrogenase (oxaloacetate-decarboxylating)
MKLIKKHAPGARIVAIDSKGVVGNGRADINGVKKQLIEDGVIAGDESGMLSDAIQGADVFLGVSQPNTLTAGMVKTMAKDAVIFAMANPTPEIMPAEAKKGGAKVVATGRSDFPNQINNSLAFPGIFRGALDHKVTKITDEHKIKAAKAIAALVPKPTVSKIVPDMFDKRVARAVAKVIR